ncbi:F0F1 ATP synthase subunit B [Zavarzinella formosa]|uniref:F0F1 ATP synthase subunit B n=1 Tax=Zavarzinella formosa TaxID=360055 RepID=UPI0003145092|nr:F0F1 ATP synthase subunit B [Zavarzinella formosa]
MRLSTLLVMWVVLTGFVVAPLRADEKVTTEEHKTEVKTEHAAGDKGHGGHEKPGVEHQFGLTRWDLGIFTLVVFLALMVILGKFAWGPMIEGLDKREAGLLKVHSDADTARAEAQKALAEIQARLAQGHNEVRAMLDEARRDAQAVKDQMKAEASADAQAERERGRKEIEMARDQALQEIYQQAVQLASLVSTKAIKRELTPSDHARLVDEALVDLKQTLSKT